MNRREFITALTVATAVAPQCVFAQPAQRLYRIGHLSGSGAAASKDYMDAFRAGLRELGYAERRDYVLEERYADAKFERLPALAKELLTTKCDVWLVSTTPGNIAAKAANSSVPQVMVLIADPVGAGVVSNLAHPGGNITGVTNIVSELAGKRLEILKEVVPSVSRVAVFINPKSQNAPLQMNVAETAARKLKIQLQQYPITAPGDLKAAFEAAVKNGAHAGIRMIDPLVPMLRADTVKLATSLRLPVMHLSRDDVEAGGLIAYGANIPEQYRQAATFVHKILKGARPGDLPVEQPAKFELAVNVGAAKAIGLTIPQSLLLRSNFVVQ